MIYSSNELFVDDETVDIYQNEWIRDSFQMFDSVKYNVYHGIGDNSLIKLMIKEEIDLELL